MPGAPLECSRLTEKGPCAGASGSTMTEAIAGRQASQFTKAVLFVSGRLQRAVFCRRRCSLAFWISLMSPTGRISQMLPYLRDGCCETICTA